MESVSALLQQARKVGFTLVYKPGNQPYWHPLYKEAKMPDWLIEKLRENREAILEWFTKPRRESQVSEEWSERCKSCNHLVFKAIIGSGCSGIIPDRGLVQCPYAKNQHEGME